MTKTGTFQVIFKLKFHVQIDEVRQTITHSFIQLIKPGVHMQYNLNMLELFTHSVEIDFVVLLSHYSRATLVQQIFSRNMTHYY